MTTKPDEAGTAVPLPRVVGARVLIIEARFYEAISDALAEGAIEVLKEAGAEYQRIPVPGALEIPQALIAAVEGDDGPDYDGVVAIGCVIRGETSHYETVCHNANHWLMHVAIEYRVPVGNAILTVETEEQAWARARGRSNKGADAARACLRLIELQETYGVQD